MLFVPRDRAWMVPSRVSMGVAVGVIFGLAFLCCGLTGAAAEEIDGLMEDIVQWECRDRYLWIHVASVLAPNFEAVDGSAVHAISEPLASRCGYTISTFKMDGFTTLRASYYSCFTQNQDDKVFRFSFNVVLYNMAGDWVSRPVSAVCSGLSWTHREVICEEDYMEVNVDKQSWCGGHMGEGEPEWRSALSEVQKMASSAYQLMFLQSDGQVTFMSFSDAQRWGYRLVATANRVVLRSQYKQPHSELLTVGGIPVEVLRVSLFFKQKLMVVLIDVSMACTVNSGSFDGAWLLWDVPSAVPPLVGKRETLETQSLRLGVDGVLLDEVTMASRGFRLVQEEGLVQVAIPYGAQGGYRKSLVVNNTYSEMFVIFMLYEHIFALVYEDGSAVETRHRLLRVLDTPLLRRLPFTIDHTVSEDQMFSVYLGNVPADVLLDKVWINRKQLLTSGTPDGGYTINPVVHANGSRAYELRLPFEDDAVHWTYLGDGVIQYSIEINYILTIMPQRDLYSHQAFITAKVHDVFPPQILAQCSDTGIAFSVVKPPGGRSVWDVGVGQETLTAHLAEERGYRFYVDGLKTVLEVPVLSIGYAYEEVNLSNFYGTFKLLLRDSKTMAVQTSTSKRCLFKTEDMLVCSPDGTITVVVTLTSTWPTVQPEKTRLLDPSCGPKQTEGPRVLFEFKLDSCGTRAMVGVTYVVYENEIIYKRQLTADGPNVISRESVFRLTVRCFYPLNAVNKLTVDRTFRSQTPGSGSIKDVDSLGELTTKPSAHEWESLSFGDITVSPDQGHQTSSMVQFQPQSEDESGHLITVPTRRSTPPSENTILNTNLDPSSPTEHHLIGTQHGPPLVSSLLSFPGFPSRLDQLSENGVHQTNSNSAEVRAKGLGQREFNLALASDSSGKISTPTGTKQKGGTKQRSTGSHWGLNGFMDTVWSLSNLGQNSENQRTDLFLRMQQMNRPHGIKMGLNHDGSSGGGMEVINSVFSVKDEERPGSQPETQYDPSQNSRHYMVLLPPAEYIPDRIGNLPNEDKKYNPKDATPRNHISTVPNMSTKLNASVNITGGNNKTDGVQQTLKKTPGTEKRNSHPNRVWTQSWPLQHIGLRRAPSGHHLHQKTVIQQLKPQMYNQSHQATGPTDISEDWNQWTSQQVPKGLKTAENVPQKQTLPELEHEQANAEKRAVHTSTIQKRHQQESVQPLGETGNAGGRQ